ncbi:FN3 associated domain-containing protein [Segetibacter koreensis]|uniref:FN3 associated domain-containing protein n=1 Tax=Segetibacter koreensis TaxID=398037 RepID=UPI00037EBBE7|nr:FN3 associated domain-containing protein [Segetibacter koreensis]
MHTLKKIGEGILTAGIIFLLFILVFQNRLHVPPWLQVVGRMHPMFLHFPIVLLLLSFFTFWLPEKSQNKEWFNLLRLVASLSAMVTAVMGILLSLEDGRSGVTLQWHKWAGVSIAVISYLFYSFHHFFSKKIIGRPFTLIASLCIVVAGHFGASLTHGENYLLAPVNTEEKKAVSIDEAIVFSDVVKPIFEKKCFSCHGAGIMKGGLMLEDSAGIEAGGKTGPLFTAGDPDASLLMHRILLPGDDKKHMPPISKPALADDEVALLRAWIKSGAWINKKLTDVPEKDSFRIVAAKFLAPSGKESNQIVYDFPAADDKKINALNNNYRVIEPQGIGSPALSVHFYGKYAYSKKSLEELLPLKQQIIQLSLARMPVKDDELAIVGQMVNLDELNLNYTDITDKGLGQLLQLKKLKQLSLSGTAIDKQFLEKIVKLPSLRSIYIWNTKIGSNEVAKIQNKFKQVSIETGYKDDGTMMALSPPMIQSTTCIFDRDTQIVVKHPFKGVDIRYTLDDTEPDSIKSPLYKSPIVIKNNITLKARAFKKGWYGSTSAEAIYIKKGSKPDSIELASKPDEKYKGPGKLLDDRDIGDVNFGNGQWLGYTKNDAVFYLYFNKAVQVESVLLTILKSTGSHIFPPSSLEVWGGMEKNHCKQLGQLHPKMPAKDEPPSVVPEQVTFASTPVKYLKIIAKPIKSLPQWHSSKGKPGWTLVSEVVAN